MARRPSLAGIGLTLLLAWLVLYPILIAAGQAADAAAIAAFVQRPGEWRALLAGLLISVASVVLAAAIGVPPPVPFQPVRVPPRGALGAAGAVAAGGPPPLRAS